MCRISEQPNKSCSQQEIKKVYWAETLHTAKIRFLNEFFHKYYDYSGKRQYPIFIAAAAKVTRYNLLACLTYCNYRIFMLPQIKPHGHLNNAEICLYQRAFTLLCQRVLTGYK
ncbi:MAG: hypothetical protein D6719_03530 [Candidatus Dadabacteria bacterium]|nr:MAG: hypothetical protein D6719_03530 [Candidatus Dadabacteria bacterium]